MSNLNDTDTRRFDATDIEVRVEGESPVIEGYAALFDTPYPIWDFDEVIAPGAFGPALTRSDVHALFDHDRSTPANILGRLSAGTLELNEDGRGLHVRIHPPSDAGPLLERIRRGDINQMSFGFRMAGGKEEWDDTGEREVRRIIEIGELTDVTVCTRGANDKTECAVRSRDNNRKSKNHHSAGRRVRRKMDLDLRERGESGAGSSGAERTGESP